MITQNFGCLPGMKFYIGLRSQLLLFVNRNLASDFFGHEGTTNGVTIVRETTNSCAILLSWLCIYPARNKD